MEPFRLCGSIEVDKSRRGTFCSILRFVCLRFRLQVFQRLVLVALVLPELVAGKQSHRSRGGFVFSPALDVTGRVEDKACSKLTKVNKEN